MEDFSLLYWIMEKHTERKEITQTISSGSTKRLGEVKNVLFLDDVLILLR